MEAAATKRLAAQEYPALDRSAAIKSEFLNGEMFAMAEGTRKHRVIAINVAAELHAPANLPTQNQSPNYDPFRHRR
jgi:hypothetical protein